MTRAQPFLRWIGGKARFTSRLMELLPTLGPDNVYFEPFAGAASLFFAIQPARAVLSDSNPSLIDCFTRVRDDPDAVWGHLSKLTDRRDVEEYYELRRRFNDIGHSDERAALFIYLNRMCFNGVWRVNRKGEFNVPFGGKARPGFPTLDQLRVSTKALQPAELLTGDFSQAVQAARSGDFVYMDPPYLPVSSTSFFRHYTAERFSIEDHERVSETVQELTDRGVRVMVTEADSMVARGWYANCHVADRAVTRFVASKGHRFEVSELIITNFRP